MPARSFIGSVLFSLAFAAAGGLAASDPAQAQDYPSQPVKLVVPYPPGGPVDAIARRFADQMARQTNHPFVVDNRAGGGGSIGAATVAGAKPDGHTLLLTIPDALINVVTLIRNLPYDPRKDFAFVSQMRTRRR